MKPIGVLALLAVHCSASWAVADCFTVYGARDEVVYQSRTSPIDLNRSISDAMAAKFPGGHLVWTRDDRVCAEFELAAAQGEVVQADRLAHSDRSALFKASSAVSGGADGGYPVLRSGNGGRSAGHDVYVPAYTKADGTHVSAHTRAAPGRGR